MKVNNMYSQISAKIALLICCFMFSVGAVAQISGGEVKPDKKKKEKKKEEKGERPPSTFERDSLSGSTYYITGLAQRSFRTFEDQTTSGVHALLNDEYPVFTSGVNIGTVIPVSGRLGLDVGLTFFGHGEGYNFEDPNSDSTYTYKNSYMQVGIPLKLRYTQGEDFQFFGFAGLTPLNILNIRSKVEYVQMDGIPKEEVTTIKDGFTTFNLMVSGGLGLNYYFSDYIGLTFSAEYRRHLMNTYSEDTFKRDHKMYGFGLNLGLQVRL